MGSLGAVVVVDSLIPLDMLEVVQSGMVKVVGAGLDNHILMVAAKQCLEQKPIFYALFVQFF